MNYHIDPMKAGFALTFFLGGMHLAWSILVVLGWAQPLIDFVLWMHMISLPIVVKAFDLTASVTLVIVTGLFGYAMGFMFAHIWNRMHRA